jgi:hypothetical protein
MSHSLECIPSDVAQKSAMAWNNRVGVTRI